MKQCNKCNEAKPEDQFYKGTGKDGLRARCKDCLNECRREWNKTTEGRACNYKSRKQWIENNRDKWNDYQREYIKTWAKNRVIEPAPFTEKACTKCEAVKPLSEFGKSPSGKHGLMAECKACKAERHKAYMKKYRGKNGQAQ